MAKKEFQAESKKLMDMMINSIYTNKEIFLRELISNASDAIDKLYYKSLTDPSVGMNKGDFRILITRDQENRILTIEDNGIGMTKEELEQNLGTIAHSGSLDFKKDNKDENIDIIGQFGVGFYSSFMVADKVTVISKAYGSDEAWQWESSGVDGYEMTPAQKDTAGTQIILHIKPDTETDHYDNFLDEYGIVAIVKKYSDYVRYPIQMERQHERQKPEPDPKPEDYKPEWETYTELETLNSMVPIWKKQKSEVTDEEYANFYKEKFGDYTDPARVIVSRTEGTANYNALLFVPSHRPYDFYTKDYEKGLALYASGVLIMEKCADLLPDYFSFVKGIVDSQDLSLNISREMLQKDNQLKLIHNALEKKIKNELHAMLATFEPEHQRSKVIGHLFQDPLKGTAPNMTIEENLALAYLRAGTAPHAIFSRISRKDKEVFREKLALLDMGLEDRMKQPVGLLSGGQRQALTLLMATLVTPKLLLLDEHTAALDPATAEKVLELTKSIVAEKKITCLMVTHNMHQALELGNRTLMMDSGRIVFDVKGEERSRMTVDDLLEKFRENAGKNLDNDRILLSKVEK